MGGGQWVGQLVQFLAHVLRQGVETVDEAVLPLAVVVPRGEAALGAIVDEVGGGKANHWHTLAERTAIGLIAEHGHVADIDGEELGVGRHIADRHLSVQLLKGIADIHVFGHFQPVAGFLDDDVVVALRAETGKLQQVVVTLDGPFVADGDGVDGWCIVQKHLIVVDGQVLRVLSLLQLALFEFPDDAASGVGDQTLEACQFVVLAT